MRSDKEHLNLSIEWLVNAQKQGNDDGVAAIYEADSCVWQNSYPETTGYIIPTLYEYSKVYKNEKLFEIATKMASWEVKIQSVEGGTGEYVGFYMTNTTKPRMFNTGQVILGLIAAYKETNENIFIESALKSSNYIVTNTNEIGYWDFSNFNTPKTYNVRVGWALMELYNIIQKKDIKNTAEKIVNWTISETLENGYINKNNFSDYKNTAFTHLLGYSLVGLLKAYNIKNFDINYDLILKRMINAGENIVKIYKNKSKYSLFPKIGLPAFFDNSWTPLSDWSCITGNTQIEYFLRLLSNITKSKVFLEVADNLLEDMKRVHVVADIDTDENLIGGLFGSYPIESDYCPFQMPNWGVKFFSDSLMQEMDLFDNTLLG